MTPETISDSSRRNVVLLAEHEQLTMTWTRFACGERGPDLHVHHEHTDAFYVLEGELTFELGADAEQTTVAAGTFVAVPPYVPHSFIAVSQEDARWLNFHAPERGFADFLRSLRAGTPGQWDSFGVPDDGGRPASEVVMAGPGLGERLRTDGHELLIKGDLDDLCVVEWNSAEPPRQDGVAGVDELYVLADGHVLHVHAPGRGFADTLRQMAD
jgi:quercetin dioxygenase-like cupin family protein